MIWSYMEAARAAKVLGASESQMLRQLRGGTLEGKKLGGHWQAYKPAVYERYRAQGGPMPIPGDLVEVSVPDNQRDRLARHHPKLWEVARYSGLLAEVDDWIVIHSLIDVLMSVVVANTVSSSNHRDGVSFDVRLVLHESGELRMAEPVWDHAAGKSRLAIWGDRIDHYKHTPRERR